LSSRRSDRGCRSRLDGCRRRGNVVPRTGGAAIPTTLRRRSVCRPVRKTRPTVSGLGSLDCGDCRRERSASNQRLQHERLRFRIMCRYGTNKRTRRGRSDPPDRCDPARTRRHAPVWRTATGSTEDKLRPSEQVLFSQNTNRKRGRRPRPAFVRAGRAASSQGPTCGAQRQQFCMAQRAANSAHDGNPRDGAVATSPGVSLRRELPPRCPPKTQLLAVVFLQNLVSHRNWPRSPRAMCMRIGSRQIAWSTSDFAGPRASLHLNYRTVWGLKSTKISELRPVVAGTFHKPVS
jgi:hypothetical protein